MASELSYNQKIVLEKFGKQSVIEMRQAVKTKKISNFRKDAVNASGKLDRSIEYRLVADGLEIWVNEYAYYLIFGRRPGKQPPYDAIRDWIDEKGIVPEEGNTEEDKDSLAWAIVISMAKKGNTIFRTFAGENSGLFSEVFDEQTLIELEEDLQDAIQVEYESMLDREFSSSTI